MNVYKKASRQSRSTDSEWQQIKTSQQTMVAISRKQYQIAMGGNEWQQNMKLYFPNSFKQKVGIN